MAPLFSDGDYVFGVHYPWLRLSPGLIVVVAHPEFGTIIKRIRSVEDNRLYLKGENKLSSSTEQLGAISAEAVLAKVIWHFKSR